MSRALMPVEAARLRQYEKSIASMEHRLAELYDLRAAEWQRLMDDDVSITTVAAASGRTRRAVREATDRRKP